MTPAILIRDNKLYCAQKYLGTSTALLWVGTGEDPKDNNDERVRKDRERMAKEHPEIPYGMWVGNRLEDLGLHAPAKTVQISTEAISGEYYEFDLSWWPKGFYRLNYHGPKDEPSEFGTKLNPSERDANVSWPLWVIEAELIDKESWGATLPFVHVETNGAGKCFRIMIKEDGTVHPFGDQV